jgi:hypothetical protein
MVQTSHTDLFGAYEIGGLQGGFYYVTASAAGYASVRSDVVDIGGPSREDLLGSRSSFREINLRLTRAGAVEGRVLDSTGEALANVEVLVEGSVADVGPGARTAVTNLAGAYYIGGVMPGERVVVARQIASVPRSSDMSRMRRTVFFPGTTSRDEAVRVSVAAGELVSGIDINLPEHRAYTIAGSLSRRPAGAEVISVRLISRGGKSIRTFVVSADGEFRGDEIGEGRHLLLARNGPSDTGNAGFVLLDVFQDLRVDNLVLEPVGTIVGRVVAPSGNALPKGLGVTTRLVVDGDEFEILGDPLVQVTADGRFVLPGLFGSRRLVVSGLPAGWAPGGASRQGMVGRTPLEVSLDPGETVSGVEIFLTRP